MAPIESLLLMLAAAALLLAASSAPVEPEPPSESVEDLLRLFNVSRQFVEASRQQLASSSHPPVHRNAPAPPLFPTDAAAHFNPSHPGAVSTAQQAMRKGSNANQTVNKSSSAAIQRKQEVYRQVMGFVTQNGRPAVNPAGVPSAFAPFARPDAAAPELYSQTNVGRVRYIQPSCDSPKHTDDELWSSSSPSMHLFFNLTGIQSQARHGHQLYVIGAKLRLLKFPEGEADPAAAAKQADWPAELVSEQEDTPIQTLQTRPFFEPIAPTDEEKIRVSVHNYTRAIKRNRVNKKKLLDSQMALAKEEGYLELDVKLAARWWLAPNGRNFGLSLEVEDMDGQQKPASHFFRPRNCSVKGVRADELTDVRDVASPVLELTVVEVPEGRHIVELPPSGARTRSDEENANEETDVEHDERKGRNLQRGHDEDSDETSRAGQHHRANNKHRQRQSRLALAPVPTLATIEDHDLFATEEDGGLSDLGEIKLMRKPASLFIQRIAHHQRQRAKSDVQ